MTSVRIIESLLLLGCCGRLLVHSTLTVVPTNKAVLVGSTVQLHCSVSEAPPASRVMWYEFLSSSQGSILSDGKTILLGHPNSDRYEIVGLELDYILQITNVTLADGGMYLCQDVYSDPSNVFRGYAELIVLESDPVCQDFVKWSGVAIEEGTSYASECEIGYRGNLIPVMEWNGPGNFTTNGSSTDKSVWSWMRFTAHRKMDGEVFTCHTNFGPVVAEPGHASNIPTYEHTYRSPIIIVRLPPTNVYIAPIKAEYVENEALTCYADAIPPPSYRWQNLRTLEVYDGQEFRIRPDMVGHSQNMRCSASNQIEGLVYSVDVFQTVYVPGIRLKKRR